MKDRPRLAARPSSASVAVRIDRLVHEDHVDVRDVVELAAAELAHADDRDPRRRIVARHVLAVDAAQRAGRGPPRRGWRARPPTASTSSMPVRSRAAMSAVAARRIAATAAASVRRRSAGEDGSVDRGGGRRRRRPRRGSAARGRRRRGGRAGHRAAATCRRRRSTRASQASSRPDLGEQLGVVGRRGRRGTAARPGGRPPATAARAAASSTRRRRARPASSSHGSGLVGVEPGCGEPGAHRARSGRPPPTAAAGSARARTAVTCAAYSSHSRRLLAQEVARTGARRASRPPARSSP